jgi:repressor LexA
MFANRLKSLRRDKGLYQKDIADYLGITTSAYGFYEQGKREADYETLSKLTDFFGVSIDYLLGRTNTPKKKLDILEALEDSSTVLAAGDKPITPQQRLGIARVLDNPDVVKTSSIPILGQIKMGIPLLAEENYYGELEIPTDIHADFALEARGDSMIGVGLLDGDYAICRKQNTAYSGDIVVALQDTGGFSEATLKYFYNGKEAPVLRAANPRYEDIPLDENWRIAGVLVAIIRKEPPSYKVYNNYLATKDASKEKWDPVIEQAFQMGIEPEQVATVLKMIYQTAKR